MSRPRPPEVDVASLDLSGLRAHVRDMHPRHAQLTPKGVARANADLSRQHYRWHHEFSPNHHHEAGQITVRVNGTLSTQFDQGWLTGQGAITRQQVEARWRAQLQEETT